MSKPKTKTQSSGDLLFLLLLLAAVAWFVHKKTEQPKPVPPQPDNHIVEPTQFRNEVEPIRRMVIDKKDSFNLVAFFQFMGDTIERDESLKSLDDVKRVNTAMGREFFADTDIVGRYPGMSKLVDDVLAIASGSRRDEHGKIVQVSIDSNKRRDLGDALRAVAWACKR